ncbi:hypothetical protein [Nocardioides kongjuensis]|uniref:hypothetical protein n=1 Tax=Nocardioides kongjuensis TaxID=349522 RepID=UPI003CD0963A
MRRRGGKGDELAVPDAPAQQPGAGAGVDDAVVHQQGQDRGVLDRRCRDGHGTARGDVVEGDLAGRAADGEQATVLAVGRGVEQAVVHLHLLRERARGPAVGADVVEADRAVRERDRQGPPVRGDDRATGALRPRQAGDHRSPVAIQQCGTGLRGRADPVRRRGELGRDRRVRVARQPGLRCDLARQGVALCGLGRGAGIVRRAARVEQVGGRHAGQQASAAAHAASTCSRIRPAPLAAGDRVGIGGAGVEEGALGSGQLLASFGGRARASREHGAAQQRAGVVGVRVPRPGRQRDPVLDQPGALVVGQPAPQRAQATRTTSWLISKVDS